MRRGSQTAGIAIVLVLFSCSVAAALDTGGMALASDRLFSGKGIETNTTCTDQQATIAVSDDPGGKRPPVEKVIDALAVVGKSFNLDYGAGYFYKMDVYYDGRKWIETLAGNCRDSFQDNIVSHCYYKINF